MKSVQLLSAFKQLLKSNLIQKSEKLCLPLSTNLVQLNQRKYLNTSRQNFFPLPAPGDLEVLMFQARTTPTEIREMHTNDRSILNCRSTTFNAEAFVKFPDIPPGEVWEIGFLQGVKKHHCRFRYGQSGQLEAKLFGLGTPEYPMINDSNGTRFPWYDKTSMLHLKGPITRQNAFLTLSDQPFVNVPLSSYNLLRRKATYWQMVVHHMGLHRFFGDNSPFLPTKIERQPVALVFANIEFRVWLVIKCIQTGEMRTLRSLDWTINFAASYDHKQPEGERISFLMNNGQQSSPVIRIDNHPEIPDSVFKQPSANDALYFVWDYIKLHSSPSIVISPPNINPDLTI